MSLSHGGIDLSVISDCDKCQFYSLVVFYEFICYFDISSGYLLYSEIPFFSYIERFKMSTLEMENPSL